MLGSTFSMAAKAADTVVVQWTDVMLQIIRDTRPTPPEAARFLAILDTCMYDAWSAYDGRALPSRPNGIPRQANQLLPAVQKAVSYAAYRAVLDLAPTDTAAATQLMTTLGYDPNDVSTNITTPSGVGNAACQVVLTYRHHDGSNQLGDVPGGTPGVPYSDYTGYVPANTPDMINNPNRWQPLRVSNGQGGFVIQKYANPYWGNVYKFNAKLPDFRTEGPDLYPSNDYTQGVDRILEYSAYLTDEQKVIAEYWANGPSSELPPGHWALFGEYVSRRDNHGIGDDAKMFFALGNAILDASIESWGTKTIFRLREAGHRGAFPQEEPESSGMGRPVSRNEAYKWPGLAALSGGNGGYAAVSGILLRPQCVQCRRRRSPEAVYRVSAFWGVRHPARGYVPG